MSTAAPLPAYLREVCLRARRVEVMTLPPEWPYLRLRADDTAQPRRRPVDRGFRYATRLDPAIVAALLGGGAWDL